MGSRKTTCRSLTEPALRQTRKSSPFASLPSTSLRAGRAEGFGMTAKTFFNKLLGKHGRNLNSLLDIDPMSLTAYDFLNSFA